MPPTPLRTSQTSILDLLAAAPGVLVLIDFENAIEPTLDGADPPRAPEFILACLRELAANQRTVAAILSEIPVKDLASLVAINGLVYAGNSGLEIRGRGFGFVEPFAFLLEPSLSQITRELAIRAAALPDVSIESGHFTTRMHIANASPANSQRAKELCRMVLEVHPQFKLRVSRDAIDIVPEGNWDKGTAAAWIERCLGIRESAVILAGDGLSSEHAFELLPEAISITIGARHSRALFRAESPLELWEFLMKVPASLASGSVVHHACRNRNNPTTS